MVIVIDTKKKSDTRKTKSIVLSTVFTKLEAPENIFFDFSDKQNPAL
jgi:hypothetical protein